MRRLATVAVIGLAGLLGSCAPASQQALAPIRLNASAGWVAVLVGGDGSLPVFDNATGAMAQLLARSGTEGDNVRRFSASPDTLSKPRVQVATRARVLDAIATLHPAPGQACLVFVTSHGSQGRGVYLAPRTEFLAPDDLDTALRAGCGAAPTVAIVSGCYTGDFARAPVAQPNRIVLTAAASDRTSFGCGAGRQFTYYDQCVLASLDASARDWGSIIATTGQCVAKKEAQEHEPASNPQSYVGRAVAGLVPVAGG